MSKQSWKNLLAEGEEMHHLRLTIAAQSDQIAALRGAAGEVLIAFSMGWDLHRVIDQLQAALAASEKEPGHEAE